MKKDQEFLHLKNALGSQLRSPKQINKLFESDCEIVQLGPKNFITTSMDSIGEEISVGLYKKISTWAWITVMSSVSDLAASGSTPLGLTLSTQWAFGSSKELQKEFFSVVNQACKKAGVPLLGGDSGYAKDHVMTSSILGHATTRPLMRTGAKAGDYVVLAHQKNIGLGPALAFRFLLNAPEALLPEELFRPVPDWKLAAKARPFAHASIDTSDGIATGIYTLATMNGLGFDAQWNESLNHPQALQFCKETRFSPIMLWLGDHGDFQTMLAVPEKNLSKLPRGRFSVIGQLTKKKEFRLKYGEKNIDLPMKQIVNCPRDVASYSALVKDVLAYLNKFA